MMLDVNHVYKTFHPGTINERRALAGGWISSLLMRFCSALARAFGVIAPDTGQNGRRP